MQTTLNEEDEYLVALELMSEELKEQLKLIMDLITRSKQTKPQLKQQFMEKKQVLFQLVHDTSFRLVSFFCFYFRISK